MLSGPVHSHQTSMGGELESPGGEARSDGLGARALWRSAVATHLRDC